MTSNTTVCDICGKSTSVDQASANGFTKINIQGEGPTKLKPLLGEGDSRVDFCQECFNAFLTWATKFKADKAPGAEVAPEPQPALVEDTSLAVPTPAVEPFR